MPHCRKQRAPVSSPPSSQRLRYSRIAVEQARSSVVEHHLDMVVVGGSIPLAPTNPFFRGLPVMSNSVHGSRKCVKNKPLSSSSTLLRYTLTAALRWEHILGASDKSLKEMPQMPLTDTHTIFPHLKLSKLTVAR